MMFAVGEYQFLVWWWCLLKIYKLKQKNINWTMACRLSCIVETEKEIWLVQRNEIGNSLEERGRKRKRKETKY